jgi:uncharacterized phage protein (TIGR01671 family)
MEDRYLFKAKSKRTGQWVEGFYFLMAYEGGEIPCIGTDPLNANDYSEIHRYCYEEIESETLCQCTGLTDKNGKLISEGDIFLAGYWKWKCKVVWDSERAAFIGLTNDKEAEIVYVSMKDRQNLSAVEVIGNIFDNPELMEV